MRRLLDGRAPCLGHGQFCPGGYSDCAAALGTPGRGRACIRWRRWHASPGSFGSGSLRVGATPRRTGRSPRHHASSAPASRTPPRQSPKGARRTHCDGTAGIRTLVIDHYRLYREALATQLALHAEVEVIGAIGLDTDDLGQLSELLPDVVILSLVRQDASASDSIRHIREACPNAAVIVLATEEARWTAIQAVNAGASGFVLQGETVENLARAVRAVAAGEIVCPSPIAAFLFSHVGRRVPLASGDGVSQLTPRQVEISALVAQGLTNKEIAHQLSISLYTVKNHIHNLLGRLELRRRLEIALFVRGNGLFPRDTEEVV